MFSPENLPDKLKYISLLEAAKYSKVYSQEYLSLRARQEKLKAVKLGRNWVTTKAWIDDYVNDENNVKTNGAVCSFTSEKEIKEIKEAEQKKSISTKEPIPAKEEILLKDVAIFEPSLKRDYFKNNSKKFIYSLGSILVVGGLIMGFLIFKETGQEKIKEITNKTDNFLTENYKKLAAQKIIFKETGLKWKNIFENTFGDVPEIYSHKTKQIFTTIKAMSGHLVSHSQRIKNIVLIFYDNPRYYVKTIWQGTLNIQKETNDYIAGFSLFIKSSFKENFYEIKNYFTGSKIFLADVGKSISSLNENFSHNSIKIIQKVKSSGLVFANKVVRGVGVAKTSLTKMVFKIKDLAFYVYNRLGRGLYFAFNPWNKENELLVQNVVAPKNEGGLIVIPSQGQALDEKTKEKIRESFSDEVEVELKDADSGVITPVFKEKKGEGYMYLMVPVKN